MRLLTDEETVYRNISIELLWHMIKTPSRQCALYVPGYAPANTYAPITPRSLRGVTVSTQTSQCGRKSSNPAACPANFWIFSTFLLQPHTYLEKSWPLWVKGGRGTKLQSSTFLQMSKVSYCPVVTIHSLFFEKKRVSPTPQHEVSPNIFLLPSRHHPFAFLWKIKRCVPHTRKGNRTQTWTTTLPRERRKLWKGKWTQHLSSKLATTPSIPFLWQHTPRTTAVVGDTNIRNTYDHFINGSRPLSA